MNALSQLKQDTSDVEQAEDRLGGGSFTLESGLYPAIIKLMYTGKSKNGATSISYIFTINDKEYKETIYVTNAKGEITYTDKNKKKHFLAGYTVANDIALLTVGKSIADVATEKKIVPIWDSNTRKEVNTEVDCVTEMHGKAIQLGIIKELDYKREEVNGEWVDLPETKNTNYISKAFHATHGKTVPECLAEKPEAEFITSWTDSWKDKVQDRTKDKPKPTASASGTTGMPGSPAGISTPASGKSLFN